MTIAITVVGVLVGTYLVLRSYGLRLMLRAEASNNAEMLQLNRDHELRIRAAIDQLAGSASGTPDERASADRVFEMLKLSRVANNSREVASWRDAPHSPQRTAVALKWAKVAADEAGYMATLYERWAVDYAQGRPPHHVSADEVSPFRMPPGSTEDDSKW